MLSFEFILGDAITLGLLYLGFSPRVAVPLYRPVLFHPTKFPEGNYDVASLESVTRTEANFTSADGTRLHGWLFRNPSAKRTILFHHGNAANLTTRLAMIELQLRAGLSVFIYDYRGFGRSEGLPDLRGICDDGCAAFDYLVKNENISPNQIINYGESLGTGVACQVSKTRPGAGLILQSGFSSLRKIGAEVVPLLRIYPKELFPQPVLDNLEVVRQKHPPLLILHGTQDTVVPYPHGQEMFSQASEPKTFVEFANSNHNDLALEEPERYLQSIHQFLESISTTEQCAI
jgi:fermentation-respiration switch protein FrsA (DUF1100 family)